MCYLFLAKEFSHIPFLSFVAAFGIDRANDKTPIVPIELVEVKYSNVTKERTKESEQDAYSTVEHSIADRQWNTPLQCKQSQSDHRPSILPHRTVNHNNRKKTSDRE